MVDKKKQNRQKRLKRYRKQNEMPKITAKDKKFGKIGLFVMGAVIVLSAFFVFYNMH